jgi:hypothetical protein
MIEVFSGYDVTVLIVAILWGERSLVDVATGGNPSGSTTTVELWNSRLKGKPQFGQEPDGIPADAIAAYFVAGKLSLVYKQYPTALFHQNSRRYAPRWPSTDDYHFMHIYWYWRMTMGRYTRILVKVGVGVFVGVLVDVDVGVAVGVSVGVAVGVLVGVGVSVGVAVGVSVGVAVGVCVGVGVSVGVDVGVGVGGASSPMLTTKAS